MKAIVEYLEGSKDVDVLYFDEYTQQVGEILDVCSREEAGQQYEIVGEIHDGRLKIFKKDDLDFKDDEEEKSKIDEDYENFLEEEFEEDDDESNDWKPT